MARRYNELFIGREHLNIQGRSIKHPSLIKMYASINLNKISDSPIDLIGIDLETNYKTAELKLLGFYDDKYSYYTDNFLQVLFGYIKYAKRYNKVLAYWNKLDPFVLYKQFLYLMDDKAIQLSLERYGHISGEWNKKTKEWDVQPVTMVRLGNYVFGIENVIRSSIRFYYYHYEDKDIKTIWAYDIASLYQNGLKNEALGKYDKKTNSYPNAKLPYYSKVDESAHLVDWDRFNTDDDYKHNVVLKSNELDARAVRDLGMMIQEEFKTAFEYYPRTLISQGSLARASIVAKIVSKYKLQYPDDEVKASKMAFEDVKSIGFMNYYDEWLDKYGQDVLKDLYALTTEAYSGGYIESAMYGYSKEAYYSDIASAYPSEEVKLYDLRDAKITHGTGQPPDIKYSYCFIRGVVHIPESVNFHPITIKHPLHDSTNIRAVGEYRASYIKEERDYLESLGATFEDETWYNIETKGILSPLAQVIIEFIDLRKKLIAEGNSAQYMAKISSNSAYGILFEATDTYEEFIEMIDGEEVLKTVKGGYRGGEFFNPIFATYITANTRIKLSKVANTIESKGGKVVLLMTDSVFWQGEASMMPSEFVRDVKTLGYFETPEKVYDLVCLGSGRYGYHTEEGYYQAKKRGLNATALHDKDGIIIKDFSWYKVLKSVEDSDAREVKVDVRTLISVGLVVNSNHYTYHDLGKVIDQTRDVDIIVGHTKRMFKDDISSPKLLMKSLMGTKPIYLGFGMMGDKQYIDQTLPDLRNLMFKKICKSSKQKRRAVNKKASKKYYSVNKDKVKSDRGKKYKMLRELGFDSKESRKYAKWGTDKLSTLINQKLNQK